MPTAERDSTIGLSIFKPVFQGVRALMYNSFEERALIQGISARQGPGVVVGVGSAIPDRTQPWRFRKKFNVKRPFAIYIGRIDENKGCAELFDYFGSYRPRLGQQLSLVLAGNSILPIPPNPRIRHLGFISDRDKFDAIAASEALIMPSRFESLSMVALEAWGLGKPVLANGRCDVLRGQTIRSRAGLYYDNFAEFAEALFTITSNRPSSGRPSSLSTATFAISRMLAKMTLSKVSRPEPVSISNGRNRENVRIVEITSLTDPLPPFSSSSARPSFSGTVSPTRTRPRRCMFGMPSKYRIRSISASASFISSIDSWRNLSARRA